MNLYVGNLPYETTSEKLQAAFSAYGPVKSAKVISDAYTGRSKGFGFVEMESRSDAEKVIAALNGSQLDGRAITVNEARPREERSDRGNFRDSGSGQRRGW